MSAGKHTPGPWDYVPSTEHHGPYVSAICGDIADCYTMSNPTAASVRNGGDSYPIPFQGDEADANARLIAAAPEMLNMLRECRATFAYAAGDGDGEAHQFVDQIDAVLAKAEGRS